MTLPACLYIVPTPIGNLGDITTRAIEILSGVDWIAAEDTRHTHKLLQHFAIQSKTMSLHDHNEDKRSSMICHRIQAGESVALVSDAGTPLISDPGYKLVRRCRDEGIDVIALPGACAAITALSASGLPTDRFIFEGFLPVKETARRNVLETLQRRTATSVFYEAPRRVLDCMQSILAVLGNEREIVVAREISKTFEHYESGTASQIIDYLNADAVHQKGEFVVMIGPAVVQQDESHDEALKLLSLLMQELPLKKAAAVVAQHYDLKKNELYQLGLSMKE